MTWQYYVYKITQKETGHYYIGVRSTQFKDPMNDLGNVYFTSGCLRHRFINKTSEFAKEIIFSSQHKDDAYMLEAELIKLWFLDPLNLNFDYDIRYAPGTKVAKPQKAYALRTLLLQEAGIDPFKKRVDSVIPKKTTVAKAATFSKPEDRIIKAIRPKAKKTPWKSKSRLKKEKRARKKAAKVLGKGIQKPKTQKPTVLVWIPPQPK